MRWLDNALDDLAKNHLLRRPTLTEPLGPTHALVDGKPVRVFCGNDYLGLRFHPTVIAAARDALVHGTGSGASRMVSGNLPEHEALEAHVARWLECDAALLANSGFAANIASLPALAGPEDVVFSDALNHASLVDAARLSRARIVVYPHADADALAEAVDRNRPFRRGWIVTESLFSMDGDLAPLTRLAEIAAREQIHLYVDEAHALGVLGPDGRGECAATRVRPDALVGTFGKAFGSAGAFLAGTEPLRRYLWSRHRGHVFSTGAPPSVAAASLAAMKVATTHPEIRTRLRANIQRLRTHLADLGRPATSHPDAPIIPIVIGDPRVALDISSALIDRGYFVQAIRPPTVPVGTARLRITLSAAHDDADIDGFARALADVLPRDQASPRNS